MSHHDSQLISFIQMRIERSRCSQARAALASLAADIAAGLHLEARSRSGRVTRAIPANEL